MSPTSLSSIIYVVDLMKEGSWNEQLIRQAFLPANQELILKIPLPHVPMKDTLFWHFDKRGNYLVKSGHQVALKLISSALPSCSKETSHE